MPIKLTTEEFIKRAKEIHFDKYDYSLVNYVSSKKKVKIICKIHVMFEQTPNDHLSNHGCKFCAKDFTKSVTTCSLEDFIDKANKIHNGLYDYSLSNYVNNHTKLIIICKLHGEFMQTPNDHLKPSGCNICGKHSKVKSKTKTQEYFIENAKEVHGDTYDYSFSIYTKMKDKIKIVCKTHGEFYQSAQGHLSGHGCALCGSARPGFNRTKFKDLVDRKGIGILYILHLSNKNENFLKIGITTRTVEHRILGIPYEVNILHKEVLTDGGDMFDMENYLHKIFKDSRYKPLLPFAGSGECFNNIQLTDVMYAMSKFKKGL